MPADCCCALSCPVLVICLPHSRGSHPRHHQPPPATSCCSCDPTQKGDGEMGHSQHRLHWGKLDWTMLGLSPYRPISHVLLLNRIQKMKYHINMLTVQNKREFMIYRRALSEMKFRKILLSPLSRKLALAFKMLPARNQKVTRIIWKLRGNSARKSRSRPHINRN